MFDKAIEKLRHDYGINILSDWGDVRPSWILEQPGVGQATLDHIRMYLAMRNQTLCDDRTPEYWKENLGNVRIAKTLTADDLQVTAPFTVLIDSREQHPFSFTNITADKSETPNDLLRMVDDEEIEQKEIKFYVPRKFQCLGNGLGDYTIEGFSGRCNVERKSMEDAHGTILGWGQRRERFVTELQNLAEMDCAAVVIECPFDQLLKEAPSRGKKTASENRKILFRQVLSWQQDFRVPWHFCASRNMAEIATFRIFQRYWEKQKQKRHNMIVEDELDSL